MLVVKTLLCETFGSRYFSVNSNIYRFIKPTNLLSNISGQVIIIIIIIGRSSSCSIVIVNVNNNNSSDIKIRVIIFEIRFYGNNVTNHLFWVGKEDMFMF